MHLESRSHKRCRLGDASRICNTASLSHPKPWAAEVPAGRGRCRWAGMMARRKTRLQEERWPRGSGSACPPSRWGQLWQRGYRTCGGERKTWAHAAARTYPELLRNAQLSSSQKTSSYFLSNRLRRLSTLHPLFRYLGGITAGAEAHLCFTHFRAVLRRLAGDPNPAQSWVGTAGKGCVPTPEILLIVPARTLLPGTSARRWVLPAALQVSLMCVRYLFFFTYLFCQRIFLCPQGSRKCLKIVSEEKLKEVA